MMLKKSSPAPKGEHRTMRTSLLTSYRAAIRQEEELRKRMRHTLKELQDYAGKVRDQSPSKVFSASKLAPFKLRG